MFIDNLELTLGEFCDLIQADDEGPDAGATLGQEVHRSATDAWALVGHTKPAIAGKPSCSSFLSDASDSMAMAHPGAQMTWASSAHLHPQGRSSAPIHHQQLPGSHANLASRYLPPEGSPHASTVHLTQLVAPQPPPALQHQQLQQQGLCRAASGGLQVHVQGPASGSLGGLPSPSAQASVLEDDDLDAISCPPASHHHHTTSVEKQRRERLNTLIEKLAAIVPVTDASQGSCGGSHGSGARRPKHAVLSDTIRLIHTLQEHVRCCPHSAGGSPHPYNTSSHHSSSTAAAVPPPPPFLPPAPSRAASLPTSAKSGSPTPAPHHPPAGAFPQHDAAGPSAAAPGTARSHPPPPACHGVNNTGVALGPLDMPLPLDIAPSATGVMVDAPASSRVWRLRVTCRDRPGLLADVAVALRGLPLNVSHASVTTTPDGKAQQVFEVVVMDASLAPEEVQCAINASLYAHLLGGGSSSHAAAGAGQQAPAAAADLAAHGAAQPQGKRQRVA